MVGTGYVAMDYLYNGSIISAGYESFNQSFMVSGLHAGWPIGLLFIVFWILLFLQNRNITFSFVAGLVFFGMSFSIEKIMAGLAKTGDYTGPILQIPTILKAFIISILVLELTGIIYMWAVREF